MADLGVTHTTELVPGGANIPVKASNRNDCKSLSLANDSTDAKISD